MFNVGITHIILSHKWCISQAMYIKSDFIYTHRIKGNEPTESNKQKKRIYGGRNCETTSLKKRHDTTTKKIPTENANPMINNSYFKIVIHMPTLLTGSWIGVKCGDNVNYLPNP